MSVTVHYWGVRGSIPAPGAARVRYGGNTPCVTVRGADGQLFVLDCGTGLRELGLTLLGRPVDAHVLLSHTHWDHIQGFPFFGPAFIPGNHLSIYGTAGQHVQVESALAGQMQNVYFPVSMDRLGARLEWIDLAPGEYEIAGARVVVGELRHTGPCIGYRLELDGCVVVYATDTEPPAGPEGWELDVSVVALSRAADLLIHDAQYTDEEYPAKRGWGHSPTSYVAAVAAAAGVRRLALFHHDPLHSDAQIEAMVRDCRQRVRALGGQDVEVMAAAEGVDLLLEPRAEQASFAGAAMGADSCGEVAG